MLGTGALALIGLLYVIVRFQRGERSIVAMLPLRMERPPQSTPAAISQSESSDPPSSPVAAPAPAPVIEPTVDTIAGRMVGKFNSWLPDHGEDQSLWRAFDQLVREILCDELEATRVRCFHREAAGNVDDNSAKDLKPADSVQPEVRSTLIEHVLATGREYVARDIDGSPLLKELATEDADNWAWVWPIRVEQRSLGVVAIAELRDADILTQRLRQTIGPLITLLWSSVENLVRLRSGTRTDQASGVLTRSEFFQLAERTLAESYAQHEPLVLLVLTLEGLRRLDDGGQWRERDALVKAVGGVLLQRVRSDDLVGRFADDRFVVALRRLDVGLGRLLSQKILAAANERIGELGFECPAVMLRVGLSPTGQSEPRLREILKLGFYAASEARRQGVPLFVAESNRETSGDEL